MSTPLSNLTASIYAIMVAPARSLARCSIMCSALLRRPSAALRRRNFSRRLR
jgi:hypothetical protein